MASPTCPIPAKLTSPQPLKELTQSAINSCKRATERVPSPFTFTCPPSLISALQDFGNFVNQLGGEQSQIDGCLVIANETPNLWWKCSGYAEIGELEISSNNTTLIMNQWFKKDTIQFNNDIDRCENRNRVCPNNDLAEYRGFPDIDKVSNVKEFMFYLHGCLIAPQDNVRRCAFVDLDIPTRISSRLVFQRVTQFATCGNNASAVLASPLNFPSKSGVHTPINTDIIPPTGLPLRGSKNGGTAEQLSAGTLVAIVLTCSIAVIGFLVCIVFTIRRIRRQSHHSKRPTNDYPLKKDQIASFDNYHVPIPDQPSLVLSPNGDANAPFGTGPVVEPAPLVSGPVFIPNELNIPATKSNNHSPKGTGGRSYMRILPMVKRDFEETSIPFPNLMDLIKAYNAVFESLELHVITPLQTESDPPDPMLVSSQLAGAAMSLIAHITTPNSHSIKFPDGLDIRFKALIELMAMYDPKSSLFSVHRGQHIGIHAPFVSVYKKLPSNSQTLARTIPGGVSLFPMDTLIHESVFPGWMLSDGNAAITARVVVNADE